jgi:hypothetical protein
MQFENEKSMVDMLSTSMIGFSPRRKRSKRRPRARKKSKESTHRSTKKSKNSTRRRN